VRERLSQTPEGELFDRVDRDAAVTADDHPRPTEREAIARARSRGWSPWAWPGPRPC
jgi:hypothetical protein